MCPPTAPNKQMRQVGDFGLRLHNLKWMLAVYALHFPSHVSKSNNSNSE